MTSFMITMGGNMRNRFNSLMKCFIIMIAVSCIAGFTGIGSCESGSDKMPGVGRIEGDTIELVQKEKPLSGVCPYSTLIVETFEVSEEFKKDYPEAISQFQTGLVTDLRSKNVFAKVLESGDAKNGRAVKVTGKIIDMRITSGAARFWAGGLAGASHMDIYVKATDTKTGKVILEKIIVSSNNPMAAAWSFGSSDRSLPTDMAQIMSAYLCTVIPSKQ
jgi:hypothetical protein